MGKIIVGNNLPKMANTNLTSLKARIFGYLAADGYVSVVKNKKGNSYEVNFYPDDYATLVAFVQAFRAVYKKEPLVYRFKGKNVFYVRCRNKEICNDLLSISKFKSLEWNFPFKVFNNLKSKKEWLRAFFDSEGYVARKYIQVQSVNKKGLTSVQKLLKEFGIESKMYVYKRKEKSWNTNYLLNINRMDMRIKFFKKIGFNHTLKRKKLQELINAGMAESG